jgi:hypothetical protein
MESCLVTILIWRKIVKCRNDKAIEYICAYCCEEIIDQEQWWTQWIWNDISLGHMDCILNQERKMLTKYNQERSLFGHNIGMEAYSQKHRS